MTPAEPVGADAPSPAPFYRRGEDGEILPTALAAGPSWVPGTQHGSMVSALMARAVEATPTATRMQLTRLTVDLSRPVPMGSTRLDTTVVRDGRRVQALDVDLLVDGRRWARGNAVRIRLDDDVVRPQHRQAPWPDDLAVTGPEDATLPSPMGSDALWDAHDARWEENAPGAGCVWLRPHHPLVEGEPLSPTVRVAMAADLVMSGGGTLPTDGYVVINPDLTLMLARLPAGDWMRVRSRVRLGVDGTGQSEGSLVDEHGWIGRSLKSLLVDRRPNG